MYRISLMLLVMFAKPVLAEDLSANQIHDQLIGQSIAWWDSHGWSAGNLVLLPDGQAVITVETPQPSSDKGNWSLRGNEVCTFWATLRDGNQKCYSVHEIEPGHFITSGGNEFRVQSAGV